MVAAVEPPSLEARSRIERKCPDPGEGPDPPCRSLDAGMSLSHTVTSLGDVKHRVFIDNQKQFVLNK
jgi:hypothetical protein